MQYWQQAVPYIEEVLSLATKCTEYAADLPIVIYWEEFREDVAQCLFRRGRIHFESGEFEEALRDFSQNLNRASRLSEPYISNLYWRGRTLVALHRDTEAVKRLYNIFKTNDRIFRMKNAKYELAPPPTPEGAGNYASYAEFYNQVLPKKLAEDMIASLD